MEEGYVRLVCTACRREIAIPAPLAAGEPKPCGVDACKGVLKRRYTKPELVELGRASNFDEAAARLRERRRC